MGQKNSSNFLSGGGFIVDPEIGRLTNGKFQLSFVIKRQSRHVYVAFKHPIVQKFARRNEFINARFTDMGNDTMAVLIQSHPLPTRWRSIPWDKIRCAPLDGHPDIKPFCDHEGLIFYRHARDLKQYILKLKNGSITRAKHIALWNQILMHNLPGDFQNHNTDVATLHFKNI